MDIDRAQPSAEVFGTIRNAPKSPSRLQVNTFDQSDDRSTTERSFHSAREEITKTHVLENVPQAPEPTCGGEPSKRPPTKTPSEPMATDAEVMVEDLDEELVVDESRSASQSSSPARPLLRKSSLTFAALPAREPLTTKKSLGTRTSQTSHLDQSNILGRFTGGKSLGGIKQSDPAEEERDDVLMNKSLGDKPVLVQEESDTDAKIKRLHNKSTTQLLHEKIHLLGKSQTARPTKSIPAAASATQPAHPQLPDAEMQPQKTQRIAAQQNNEEDDDDWIEPPNPISQPAARPPLSKSVSTDVMEEIRGKQTIGDKEFDIQKRERSASRPELPHPYARKVDDVRTASDSRAASPGIYSAYDGVKTFNDVEHVGSTHDHRFGASTTPFGSPSSKRHVDGPLSASKSKLQSIMKTAKSLFSSSAGVSAQAKMDLLSPSEEHGHESSNWKVLGGNGPSKTQDQPISNTRDDTATRKTRSSAEKEEKRRQEARGREVVEKKYIETHESNKQKALVKEHVNIPAKAINNAQPLAKPTRTSPRKIQNQEAPEVPERTTSRKTQHQDAPEVPPHTEQQSRPSQTQRTKDPRRPTKPAKEAGPRPRPQPVAIRVGMPSTQRIQGTNATISSNLQESLQPPQPKQPVIAKKPSLQTSASNSSLKSSVNGMAKPKALIAAERKKEQVRIAGKMLS